MTRPLLLRLLLGGLLWFGAEFLLWGAPRLGLPDVLIHAVAALTLSALLLDAARLWRARGLYGLLALAGLYGLAALILFEPSTGLAELPRLLVARGLGAQTLAGLSMLALWLTLLRGRPVVAASVAAFVVGVGWSIWSRGNPTVSPLLIGAVAAVAVFALGWLAVSRSTDIQADDFALSLRGRAVATLILAAIAGYRLAVGALDPLTLAIAAALIVFIAILLRFQRSKRAVSLLDSALPPAPPNARLFIIPVAFIVGGAAGTLLPPDAVTALDVIVTAFGLAWLPAMSFVIGARALLREVRAQQL